MTEEAKAVGEVAKTAGKALDIVQGTGGWLKSVLGTLPKDLVGVAGADWVHEKRRRNLADLQAQTAEYIAALAPDRLTEPSPSLVLPLLQAAADEGRPELQARWAALLANAMTDDGRRVRRAFFETLAKMEPADAVLLDILVSPQVTDHKSAVERATALGLSETEDVLVSYIALDDLKCIWHDPPNEQQAETRTWFPSAYGYALVAACSPPQAAPTPIGGVSKVRRPTSDAPHLP